MMLERKLTIRPLDVLLGRSMSDSQELVVVTLGHDDSL
jgi:hypothetical protein